MSLGYSKVSMESPFGNKSTYIKMQSGVSIHNNAEIMRQFSDVYQYCGIIDHKFAAVCHFSYVRRRGNLLFDLFTPFRLHGLSSA